MLEKTRVTLDFPHERNFNIFYYVLAGLDKSLLAKLHLADVQSHQMRGKAQRILSSSFELYNIQAEQFEFRREPFCWQSQVQCDQVSVEKQRDPFENGSRMHAEER